MWRNTIITAFGKPVVPELKLKNAQTSPFFLPLGILKLEIWPDSPKDLPISKRVFTVVKPSRFPSRRKILSLGIPAFFAAGAATSMAAGTVMRNFAPALLSAYVISSMLYAGDAPETIPPGIQFLISTVA